MAYKRPSMIMKKAFCMFVLLINMFSVYAYNIIIEDSRIKKDEMYEAQMNELNQIIQNLEAENSQIKNSNSWKMTKNLRKIGKKFK